MNIIVAVFNDWGIGCDGRQTIIVPEDRRFFREKTRGGIVIAGRKAFEEIATPLPDRKNIILTQNKGFNADGLVTAHSVDEVLSEISGEDPDRVFVIGGGEIYRLFLPFCDRAYITRLDAAPKSDTFFPDLDALPVWSLESELGIRTSECGINYSFSLYRNDQRREESRNV